VDKAVLLDNVCNLVRKYYSVEDVSIYELVKTSGYFEHYAAIRPQDIASQLENDPALITDWMQYSADKRSSDGWFISGADGDCTVGSIFDGKEIAGQYRSATDACALFIKHELEGIRLS